MRWPKLQTQNLSQTDIPKDGKGDIMPQYCNRSNSFLFQSMAYVEVFPVDSCVQLTRPKTYLIISRWGGCGNLNQNLSIDVTLETSLSFWRANLNNDKKPISISIWRMFLSDPNPITALPCHSVTMFSCWDSTDMTLAHKDAQVAANHFIGEVVFVELESSAIHLAPKVVFARSLLLPNQTSCWNVVQMK